MKRCPLHPKKPTASCGICRKLYTVPDEPKTEPTTIVSPPTPPVMFAANGRELKPPRVNPVELMAALRTPSSLGITPDRIVIGERPPCRYELDIIERCTQCGAAGERNHVRECEVHDRCTRGPNNGTVAACSSCRDWAPMPFFVDPARPVEGTGIVIGCYGFPKLAALSVRMIRETCGDVPILLADDCSGHDAEFEEIASQNKHITFWPSETRLGHYAGDLSVFWKGLQWAHTNKFKWLCKLSMRFIWTQQNWLSDAIRLIEPTPHHILMQRCTDAGPGNGGRPVDLKIRSEAVLLDAPAWIPFYNEMTSTKLNNPTEFFLWHIIHREWGGKFAEWKPLTVNRYAVTPGTLWHGSHTRQPYDDLAARFGMELDKEFHVNGHQNVPGWKRG